ncbi:MAG TPA: hypothetical protein DDZ32_09860 [Gammaproteobacteria bacterium]|nr:hypothetical protein [Gammaproteobacteria bacterium]HBK13139.1 hypothetical protein [Gammaproteobacteria bacterium]
MQNSSSSKARFTIFRLLALSACLGGCISQDVQEPIVAMDDPSVPPLMLERIDGITATGYAVIDVQKGQTHAQRRLMAIRASKLDAYRNLTEQVYGLYVESASQMGDLALRNESVRARVQGLVYGSRLVSITPLGGETYETKLALEQSVIDELVEAYRKPVSRERRAETVTNVVAKDEPEKAEKRGFFINKSWFKKGAS